MSTDMNSLNMNRVGVTQNDERKMKALVSENSQNSGLSEEKIRFVLGSNAEKMSINIRS